MPIRTQTIFSTTKNMAQLMTVHMSQKLIILRHHIKWGELSVTH